MSTNIPLANINNNQGEFYRQLIKPESVKLTIVNNKNEKAAVPLLFADEGKKQLVIEDELIVTPPEVATVTQAPSFKPTSKIETFANLIKGNIGTGILSLPFAMRNAGLVVGTLGLIIVGFLCTFCMHQLLGVYRKVVRKRPNRQFDYADVAEAVFADSENARIRSFATVAKHITNFFICFTQIGICICYLSFCPSMVRSVIEAYTDIRISLLVYQAITTALLIPYCFFRTLNILAIFSMIANFLTIVSLVVIMQYVFRNMLPWQSLPLAKSGGEFFMFFGSVMFAYSSITFVLPLEMKMKDRGSFHYCCGLMSLGMVCVIALYTAVAFYGYLAFGDESMLILKNLPDFWLYNSLRVVYAICIFLSYNLQMYIPVEILWPPIKEKCKPYPFFHKNGEYILRPALVLLTFALSAGVPCLEQMISLVGSLAISSLALVLPAVMEIVANMPSSKQEATSNKQPAKPSIFPDADDSVNKWGFTLIVIRGIIIIIIGIAASIIGTYVVVEDIVRLLSEGKCS